LDLAKTTSAPATHQRASTSTPVALSLAIDGTRFATNPDEMRNSLGKAVAEVAERRNDEDDNENDPIEMALLPAALRRLEPHPEPETVQYCSFWWAAALHLPRRCPFATGRQAIKSLTSLPVPGSCSAPNRRTMLRST